MFDRLKYTGMDNTWVKRTTEDGIKQELISTNYHGKPTLAIIARHKKTKKYSLRIYTHDWEIVRSPAVYYSTREFAVAGYLKAMIKSGFGI